MVVTVPPIREYFGYRRADMVPTTYPRALTSCQLYGRSDPIPPLNASSQTITETGTWLRRSLRREKGYIDGTGVARVRSHLFIYGLYRQVACTINKTSVIEIYRI